MADKIIKVITISTIYVYQHFKLSFGGNNTFESFMSLVAVFLIVLRVKLAADIDGP